MPKLPAPQVAVLRAASAGNLRRSLSIQDHGASYIEADSGRFKNVTAVVKRLTDREPRLLEIVDDGRRWSRPWLLTDAGKTALAEADDT